MGKWLKFTMKDGEVKWLCRPELGDDAGWGRAYALFRYAIRVEEF